MFKRETAAVLGLVTVLVSLFGTSALDIVSEQCCYPWSGSCQHVHWASHIILIATFAVAQLQVLFRRRHVDVNTLFILI